MNLVRCFALVLLAPLMFGMRYLFEWMDASAVAKDAVLTHKALYLNGPFFISRQVIYFAIWIFLALRLNALSKTFTTLGQIIPRNVLLEALLHCVLALLDFTFPSRYSSFFARVHAT